MLILKKNESSESLVKLRNNYYTLHPQLIQTISRILKKWDYQTSKQTTELLIKETLTPKHPKELEETIILINNPKHFREEYLASLTILLLLGYTPKEILKITTNNHNKKLLNKLNLTPKQIQQTINILDKMLRFTLVITLPDYTWMRIIREAHTNTIQNILKYFQKIIQTGQEYTREQAVSNLLTLFLKIYNQATGSNVNFQTTPFQNTLIIGTPTTLKQFLNTEITMHTHPLPIIKIKKDFLVVPTLEETLLQTPPKTKVQPITPETLNKLLKIKEIKNSTIITTLNKHTWIKNKNNQIMVKKALITLPLLKNKQLYILTYNTTTQEIFTIPIKPTIEDYTYTLNLPTKNQTIIEWYYHQKLIKLYKRIQELNQLC